MLQTLNFSKKMFLASVGLLCYFSLVFTGLIAKIDLAIVGAVYELITIPLILLVVAVFSVALFQFLVKRKTNFYTIASCIVALAIIVLMFVIQ